MQRPSNHPQNRDPSKGISLRRSFFRILLDVQSFTGLIMSFVGYDESSESEIQGEEQQHERTSNFAKRLVTGAAAEQYFESVRHNIPEFADNLLENTTRLGCGFDYRLRRLAQDEFVVVEVKGLRERGGSLSLTPKEHDVAQSLKDRFFLFVVKNFQESPFHEIFQDPLSSRLRFRRTERVTVQISWLASI